jgi:hypothetical protein
MSHDDPETPGPAYRGETGAAKARVEALERELSDARGKLDALRPRDDPGGPRLIGGLRLVLVSKAIDLALFSLSMVVLRLLPSSSLGFTFTVIDLAYLGGTAVAILGLIRLQSVSTTPGVGLLRTSLVGECLCGVLGLLGLAQNLVGGLGLGLALALGWRAAALLGGVPLLLFYHGLGRRFARPHLASLAIVALVLFTASQVLTAVTMLMHGSALGGLRSWLALAVSILAVTVAGLALPAARAGQASLGLLPAANGGDLARAAAGLRLHRVGILVKIGVALLGLLLIYGARGAGSSEAARAFLALIAVGGLLGGALTFAGLARYASLPEGSGKTLAITAALLAGGGLAVELCSTLFLGVAIAGDRLGLVRAVALLEPIGLSLSLPALLLLLLSLRQVALRLSSRALATRAQQLAILVAILAPIVVLLKLPAVTRELGLAVFALGVPALCLGIYLVLRYLGLLKGVAEALEA